MPRLLEPTALLVAVLVAVVPGCGGPGEPVPDPDKKLSADVLAGDVDGVRRALRAGADVNKAHGPEEYPVLVLASLRASVNGESAAKVAGLLLDAGADPNARTIDGASPIGWAASSTNVALVDVLLEGGADPDSQNDRGWTPLMSAAQQGNLEIVDLLLEAGADPGLADGLGRTALVIAERQGDPEVIERLRERASGAT